MTVSSSTARVSYSGNGVTTVFAVPFYFLSNSHLLVTLRSSAGVETTQVLGTNYTVTGAGVLTGGTITMTAAPASGSTLVIVRNVPLTQETDLQPNDRLPAETLEQTVDKLTMITQQLDESVDRSLKFPITDSSSVSPIIPPAASRAEKYLGFDSSGVPTVASGPPTPYNSVDVSYIRGEPNAVIRNVRDRLRDFVSVKDFGAVGDGVTDDTLAIQRALNANAGSVFLPAGTYLVSQINVPSNTYVYGVGPASVLKQKTSPQFTYCVNVYQKTKVRLSNFQIDGNGNAQPSGEWNHGVRIGDSTYVMVDNLVVHDCNGDAIYMASTTANVLCKNISVTDCFVYNFGRHGIVVAEYGAAYVDIVNNHTDVGTYVTTSSANGNGIHFELDSIPSARVGFSNVIGNICRDNGISFGGFFENLNVVGNTVHGGVHSGGGAINGLIILVNVQNSTISNNALFGDNVTNCDGIFIEAAFTGEQIVDIVISGNTINRVAGHGINCFGAFGGAPTRLNISNNVISDIGAGQLKDGISIATSTAYTYINGNSISNTTNLGIVVQATPSVGIVNNILYNIGTVNYYAIYLDSNVAGTGPAIVSNNTAIWDSPIPAGSTGCRIASGAPNGRIQIYNNDFSQSDIGIAFGTTGSIPDSGSWANIIGDDATVGSFTLAAAASTTVANTNVNGASKIILMPTNAAAATLMSSSKALYVSARTLKTSFVVSTADGTNAAGTETFEYWVST